MIEGLLYDWENERTLDRQRLDVAFYLALIERTSGRQSRVLELGCGTGRVALPLAAAGHIVTAVDCSSDRLELLQSKDGARSIDVVLDDMCNYRGTAPFDIIIVPYSSFLLLPSTPRRLACLARIAENLSSGGIAVLDLSPNFLAHAPTEGTLRLAAACPPLQAHVEYVESVRQDYVRQVTTIHRRYAFQPLVAGGAERQPVEYKEIWHTLKVDEMRWLVAQTDLRILSILGTYEGEPLFRGDDWRPGSYKTIYLLARGES